MSDEITRLAEQSGLNLDSAQSALGGLLAFLQEKLGADAFEKLRASVPDAGDLVAKFQAAEGGSGGGILGGLTEAAGKLLGGQARDASDLLQRLTGAGLSMEQIQAFLPKALEWIRSKVPPEILGRILEQLPDIPGLELPGSKAP